MFGSRSVPPAISMARGPSPARIFAASATERGARCSNHGSLSIALGLLAVALFPRQQRTLPDFLRAVGSVRIVQFLLDQCDLDLGHVERREALVVEHRGRAMHQ